MSFYKPLSFKQSISFYQATFLFTFVCVCVNFMSRRISFLVTHLTCADCNHVTMLPTQLVAFVLYCNNMVLFV